MVKGGFFILVSNKEMSAQETLGYYFDRAEIEEVFKKAKTYLELLPLSKWTVDRIYGKLLFDCMNLIFHLEMTQVCKLSSLSPIEIAGYTESLMCKVVLCQEKTEKNFIVFPEKFQISGLLPKKTLLSA